jgi:hypothetical protein
MPGMASRYRLVVDVSFSSALNDEAAGPGGAPLPINLRGVLLALLAMDDSSASTFIGRSAFCLLLLVPPPAGIGALVRRQLFGLTCGAASAFSLGLWLLLHE